MFQTISRLFVALFCVWAARSIMPSWGNYHFFPLAFQSTGADRAFRTLHTANGNFDFFDRTLEVALWNVSLGGLSILPKFIDEWDAFHEAVAGMQKPFLFRLFSRRFEIQREQPGGIGTGNGVATQFQLSKSRSYPNGPTNLSREIVQFPWHDYPAMNVPTGSGQGTQIYETEYVRVWVNGTEKTLGTHFTVNRETGVLAFTAAPPNGALIQASCKFFVLLHGQDKYSPQLTGGTWKFPQGATLFQVASEVPTSGLEGGSS